MTLADDRTAVERHFRLGHQVAAEPYTSALEFLRALDPMDQRWTPATARACRWVFRGQADARWGLTPSAWRGAGKSANRLTAARGRVVARRGDLPHAWEWQDLAERELLRDFLDVVAREGLPLPPDMPAVGGDPHPVSEFGALAQHYGVPTRLLDFTRDPYVGAFWALPEGVHAEDGALAVWAVREGKWQPGAELVAYAKDRNRNLLAQDGVVVHMTMADHFIGAEGRLPALEECKAIGEDDIVKLTLPWSKAGEMRRLLEVRGVTRARLMPGYASAATTSLARLT
ncbi:MAG: FRG domain-containing protein [Planctomycetes bacterium]|nr:FRG domain-containing protein [Planctomycetota bacterium]